MSGTTITEDAPRGPGLNMQHGFLKKIERNQQMRQQQAHDEPFRKQEVVARMIRKEPKPQKPTRQIYRPPAKSFSPGLRSDCSNGGRTSSSPAHASSPKEVHFAFDEGPKATATYSELRSALKRSKSFGGHDPAEDAGFDKDLFPQEYQGLVKKALIDPNALTSRQLMEVVRVLCNKAVEGIKSAQPTAHMCFTIIEKEKGETFLESLLNSCREWFNERDKLLRGPLPGASSGPRRWTAYIYFLMELYLRLKTYQGPPEPPASSSPPEHTSSHTDIQRVTLVLLIYECLTIILCPPSTCHSVEIECLRSTLTTVGHQLEQDSSERMERLVSAMRDAFLSPGVPAPCRKTLLELIELRSSHWKFNVPQTSYYFPYTSSLNGI